MRDPDWSDEHTAELVYRWNKLGETAAVIAAALGRTRQSVGTKVARLRARGIQMVERRSRPRLPESSAIDGPAAAPLKHKPGRKTIHTLTDLCCRWPLGEPGTPEFRYCGERKIVGAYYCEEHLRRAYQPARSRRNTGSETEATPSKQLESAD